MPSASPCIDDEALFALARGQLTESRLQPVEAHLKDCADCRAVLAEAARALEPTPGEEAAPEPGPTRIARYEITALLGAGAAGVVYRAFDPQLRRPVALKLLRPALHGASPEQSARLLREAQAMARLSDPHVVAVYDVGLHDGTVYLVMEYIDGHTLSAWLRLAPRSTAEILGAFADAGRGLVAAHQKGLVHRDFKPENVLVALDGRARVTDFGLARESESWLRERQTDDQASTELYAPTRGLIGTPAYMAPELFEGGLASPASDQFAFCVALFVALFEQHPFKAGEGIALSELITRVRAGTLQKPAFASASAERLFVVLRRGLSAVSAARFAGVPELLGALEKAAGKSQRARLAGFGLLLVLVLGGVGWWLTDARGADAARVRAAAASSSLAPARVVATAAAEANPAEAEPLRSAPSAPVASAPPAPTAPAGAERRRPPKPTDVRYKDWLKDPF